MPIVVEGGSDVCEGAHRLVVMKKAEVRLRRSAKIARQRAEMESHPFKKQKVGQPRNCLVFDLGVLDWLGRQRRNDKASATDGIGGATSQKT